MTKIWFSYSFPEGTTLDSPEPNRSPYHHTWHTGRMLRQKAQERGWEFEYRNLDDTRPVTIGTDDIVIGHVWFNEGSFMQQALAQECRAKFVIQPYTEKMVGKDHEDILHDLWSKADWLFLNTGPFWWDTMEETPYAQYKAKATRLDNVANPDLHPFSKTSWSEPGKRSILCIGYDNPIKGLDKVAELARVAGLRTLHLGSAAQHVFEHVPQCTSISGMVFEPDNIKWICQNFDAFVSMGRFDANPTALSETALWGLLGMTTKQSGYWPDDPFIELRLDDMAHNLDIIDWFQRAPAPELAERAAQIRERVLSEHNIQRRLDIMWVKMLEVMG